MTYLSRKFSGHVFLYVTISYIILQSFLNAGSYFFPQFLFNNFSIILFFGRTAVFAPPILVIIFCRYPLKQILRINTFSPYQFAYTVGIAICLYVFTQLFSSLLNALLDNLFIHYYQTSIFTALQYPSYYSSMWPVIITTGLYLTILKEIIFRGAIQSGFYNMNPFKACFIVGVLYALIELNIIDIIPYIILGFVLCFISIKTGSIIPGIIMNFLIYIFSYFDLIERLYFSYLSPLGLSHNAGAMVLIMLSIVLGGILLIKMPVTAASHSILEYTVLPDDSEKKNKNIAFIIGVVLLVTISLTLAGYTIYAFITSY